MESDKAEERTAVLNVRTSEAVRQAAKKAAAEQERSVNWVLDKALRAAFGLEKQVEA